MFLPALSHLSAAGDFNWIQHPWHSWLKSPILKALNQAQASALLKTLVLHPKIEYDSEHIVAAIAENWPEQVITFIGERQGTRQSADNLLGYEAVPFQAHELQAPLASVPEALLRAARTWFE